MDDPEILMADPISASLLPIFSFLLALRLEHASTTPITIARVAGSTLIVRTIRHPFKIGGRGILHVLQLPTVALSEGWSGVEATFLQDTSQRGHLSQMFAQVLVHLGVILPLHGQLDQQIDQVII